MLRQLPLLTALLSLAACVHSNVKTLPVDAHDAPAVADLIDGVRLAVAQNNPEDWDCDIEDCATAKDVCKKAKDATKAECDASAKAADDRCAQLTGDTASTRCARQYLIADAVCTVAKARRDEACGPYDAVKPPSIKRIGLELQTVASASGEAKLAVVVAPVSASFGGSRQDKSTRSMKIELVTAPKLEIDKTEAPAELVAKRAVTADQVIADLATRSRIAAPLAQEPPPPIRTIYGRGVDSARGVDAGPRTLTLTASADTPAGKEPSEVAKSLADALTTASQVARTRPLKSEDGEDLPATLAMQSIAYRYELSVSRSSEGKIGIELTPISFEVGGGSGYEAGNVLELELER